MDREAPVTVTVRLLANDDAPAYHALRLEGLRSAPSTFGSSEVEEAGLTRAQVEARLTGGLPDIATFGAFLGGQLVGTATLLCNPRVKTGHRANVVGMYVAEPARGHGVGRRLIDAIVARARTIARIDDLTLSVTVGNTAARRLYESAGFEAYAIEPHALKIDGQYYDMDMMILRLNKGT